jgi:hypothetical protein
MATWNGVGLTLAVEGKVLNGFDMIWFMKLRVLVIDEFLTELNHRVWFHLGRIGLLGS